MNEPYEAHLEKEHQTILGMDEAGRGPICGPVSVAGVIFPNGYRFEGINDSKKLSEKKRAALYHQILKDALFCKVVLVPETVIDEKNIYRAVQEAMEQIASEAAADYTLTDCMPLRNGIVHESLVHGDARSLAIAAASIVAKVTRDRYMKLLDQQFPQYGLAKHKGYPTKAHLEALDLYGLQDFYRKSYKPVQKRIEKDNRLTLF